MASDASPTAIDLFSGAGGLTLGLKKAGFRVVAGVELNERVGLTYKANHPEIKIVEKDVSLVTGKELRALTGLSEIDLVAGCPPCQGFSKLTDKYRREDPRNQLVLEMARLVDELRPRAVMMENVAGLVVRGAPLLQKFVRRLEKLGYVVNCDVLQLANYGVPQSRRRLVLLAGRGFTIDMPKQTHARAGAPANGNKPWLTLRDALKFRLGRAVTLSHALENGGPQDFNWHVVSDLAWLSLSRYRAIKPGRSREALPIWLRPKCHRKRNVGFQNVYGRMTWSQTPVTITGGCTTPCKGRFGHPAQLRTISVREAALIQTFPLRYKFTTDFKEVACEMIGNALPPKFARIAASRCLDAIASQITGDE
jgi:DNA (cytosine-5)-methyltransferase 1